MDSHHKQLSIPNHLTRLPSADILAELHARLATAEKHAEEVGGLRGKVAKFETQEQEMLRLLRQLPVPFANTVNEKECSLVEAISTVVKYYSSTTTTSVEIPEEKPVLGQGKSVLDSSTEAVKINQPKRQDGNGRLRFTMFLGSVRENRNADRVKKFLLHTLEKLNISVTVFDPLDFNYTQLIQPLHYYPNQQEAPQALRDINDVVRKADGHIFVTPEYHASMGPSLATLVGQIAPLSFAYRPAAIVSYSKGRYGGIRAAMQLRTYLSELGLMHVPAMLAISHVEKEISTDGMTENSEVLVPTAKLMEEMIWFAEAVKEHAKEHQLLYRGKLWSDHGPSKQPPKQ